MPDEISSGHWVCLFLAGADHQCPWGLHRSFSVSEDFTTGQAETLLIEAVKES